MDLQAKGDGFLLATSHGAGSANLQLAMVVSTMAVSNKVFYSTAPLLAGGIIVNQDGNRFVNELVTYTDTPRAIVKQQKVFAVLGERNASSNGANDQGWRAHQSKYIRGSCKEFGSVR